MLLDFWCPVESRQTRVADCFSRNSFFHVGCDVFGTSRIVSDCLRMWTVVRDSHCCLLGPRHQRRQVFALDSTIWMRRGTSRATSDFLRTNYDYLTRTR